MKSNCTLTILALAMALPHLDAVAQVSTVNLGTAENFGVLAGSAVTNTGPTSITGNVGVSPGTSITGAPGVTGTIHINDGVAAQAQLDLTTAYVDAANRPSTLIAADLANANLVSGVYSNPALMLSTGSVLTLNGQGNADSVWIFQSGSDLIIGSGANIMLINGAEACRIFWQVTSSATLGTGASFQGNILALTSITAATGATVSGRLLARNGLVSLDTNTIVAEICAVVIPDSDSDSGEGAGSGPKEEAARRREELKRALILASQIQTINSLPGLTSIYTQGFGQFDTEVFALQQRFADLRLRSRATERPRVFNREPFPSSKNPPWEGKNPISGEDEWLPEEVELAEDDRWGFFITGTGDTISGYDNYDGSSIGTNVGIDYWLTENLVVGLSVGYAHSESDLIHGSTFEADGGKAALYGMYQEGGFFTEGLVGGGYNSYDIKRAAFLGDAKGDTHGTQFDAYAGMGYDLAWRGWTITPMASLLYTRVGIDGYDEVGSLLPLIIDSQDASSLRSRVGPRVAYTSHWGGATVTPSFSAQWQHEYMDDQLPFDARFANDPADVFTVYGPKVGRDSLLMTAGLNVAWKNYAAYLAYQADLGRENYESHSALIGMRVSW